MSNRNLLKRSMTKQNDTESVLIDTNALIAERIESLRRKLEQTDNLGFTAGLRVERVEVDSLVTEEPDPVAPTPADSLCLEETASPEGEVGEAEPSETPKEAEERAQRIISDAKAAATQILQDAITDSEAEVEKLRQEGYQKGYQEGMDKAQLRLQEELARLEDQEKAREAEYEAILAELEPKFVDCLSDLYSHLFHVELSGYRDILISLISDCIRGTESSRSFRVCVSPEDYTYVSARKNRLLEAAGTKDAELEVVEDPTLQKNDCLIKTENSVTDCGLGTQLEELTRKLRLLAYGKK